MFWIKFFIVMFLVYFLVFESELIASGIILIFKKSRRCFMKKRLIKTRDPFFVDMVSRKSGSHRPSKRARNKKLRRKIKLELKNISPLDS